MRCRYRNHTKFVKKGIITHLTSEHIYPMFLLLTLRIEIQD